MSVRKASSARDVVALRKALPLHQPLGLQHGVREEEAVGGDEVDLRRRRPALQKLAQDAGGRGLADRHRAADADDEGHLRIVRCRGNAASRGRGPASRSRRTRGAARSADRPAPPRRARPGRRASAAPRSRRPSASSACRRGASPIPRSRRRGRATGWCASSWSISRRSSAPSPASPVSAVRRCKLGLHRVEGDAGDVEQHEKVVEHVGRLGLQPLAVALDRGDRGLDRLLAELLGACGDAGCGELRGIGAGIAGGRARAATILARSSSVNWGILAELFLASALLGRNAADRYPRFCHVPPSPRRSCGRRNGRSRRRARRSHARRGYPRPDGRACRRRRTR